MDRLKLHIQPAPRRQSLLPPEPEGLTFEVPNLQTALVVTEITMPVGVAEVWCGDKRIAHLRRQHANQPSYWAVGGNSPE